MRCLGQDGAGSLAALKHVGRAEKQYNAFREEEGQEGDMLEEEAKECERRGRDRKQGEEKREEGGTKKMERRMVLEVEGKERRRDGSGARSAAGREKGRRSRDRGGMG